MNLIKLIFVVTECLSVFKSVQTSVRPSVCLYLFVISIVQMFLNFFSVFCHFMSVLIPAAISGDGKEQDVGFHCLNFYITDYENNTIKKSFKEMRKNENNIIKIIIKNKNNHLQLTTTINIIFYFFSDTFYLIFLYVKV